MNTLVLMSLHILREKKTECTFCASYFKYFQYFFKNIKCFIVCITALTNSTVCGPIIYIKHLYIVCAYNQENLLREFDHNLEYLCAYKYEKDQS